MLNSRFVITRFKYADIAGNRKGTIAVYNKSVFIMAAFGVVCWISQAFVIRYKISLLSGMIVLLYILRPNEAYSSECKDYLGGTASLTYSYSDLNKTSIFNSNNFLGLSPHNYLFELMPTINYKIGHASINSKLYLTSDKDSMSLAINELFLALSFRNDNSTLTLGEKREVWGNGITWNPANIMTREILYDVKRQRNRPLEAQKGRLMVKSSNLIPNGSYEIYLLPMLTNTKGDYEEGVDVAAKFNCVISNIETNVAVIQTVAGGGRESRKSDVSIWASYVFPNNITVFMDQAISFHNRFIYPKDNDLSQNENRRKKPVFSTLIGASYRFDETVIRLEFYYNGFGYSRNERGSYISGIHNRERTGQFAQTDKWLDTYEQFLLSRLFAGLSLIKENIARDLDSHIQVIYGVEDKSYPIAGDLTYHINNRFDANAGIRWDVGAARTSEFRQQLTSYQVITGVTWHF